MTIETGIVMMLRTAATAAGDRIYPLLAPESAALPRICYQRISTPRVGSHDGPSGLALPTFQITCIAATYAAARSLAGQVRAALDGKTGLWHDVVVGACFLENELDSQVERFPGSDELLYLVLQDYQISYQE